MKAGVRVVSNTFDMGDWTPDEIAEAGGNCTSYCRALLWIVPAKVEGRWKSADGEVAGLGAEREHRAHGIAGLDAEHVVQLARGVGLRDEPPALAAGQGERVR